MSAWIPLAAKVNDVLRFLELRSSQTEAAAIGLEAVAAALEIDAPAGTMPLGKKQEAPADADRRGLLDGK